jgi:ankyrin
MWAAAEGHTAIVRELIHARASVGAPSTGGFTARMFAAQSGDVESARDLLAAGANLADVNRDRKTPLIVAAGSGHIAMVQLLMDRGADPNEADSAGMTSLHAAVWGNFNNVAMIKLLLARGADPNVRLTRSIAQRLAYTYSADLWYRTRGFSNMAGATPFALATSQGDVAAMRTLAEAGADPTIPMATGSTPLMLAAGFGWTTESSNVPPERALAAAELVLELGGNVNAKNAGGRTALHAAANNGLDALIPLLAARGADINAIDGDGYTPLWTAEHAQMGASVLERPSTMKVLRDAGAKDIAPDVKKAAQ